MLNKIGFENLPKIKDSKFTSNSMKRNHAVHFLFVIPVVNCMK